MSKNKVILQSCFSPLPAVDEETILISLFGFNEPGPERNYALLQVGILLQDYPGIGSFQVNYPSLPYFTDMPENFLRNYGSPLSSEINLSTGAVGRNNSELITKIYLSICKPGLEPKDDGLNIIVPEVEMLTMELADMVTKFGHFFDGEIVLRGLEVPDHIEFFVKDFLNKNVRREA